jgi:hypothetical protein
MGISASFVIHLTDLASPYGYAVRNLIALRRSAIWLHGYQAANRQCKVLETILVKSDVE